MLRTNNQSKYIHDNLPGDRVYGQTAKSCKANRPNYRILSYSYRILGRGQQRRIEPTRYQLLVVSSRIINKESTAVFFFKNC